MNQIVKNTNGVYCWLYSDNYNNTHDNTYDNIHFSFYNKDILIENPYNYLLPEEADKILIYLGLAPERSKKYCNDYKIPNTIENRKKVDNVEIAIKKILEEQQKEAEEFINNYINSNVNTNGTLVGINIKK